MDEFLHIIEYLQENTYVSSKQFATYLKISNKTLTKKIEEVNDYLSKFKVRIVLSNKKEYSLEIENQKLYQEMMKAYIEESYNAIPVNDSQRVTYVLNKLLKTNEYVKRMNLAEQLYVSEKTVSSVLSMVEKILRSYNLKLERKPNYGIRVTGSEFFRRQCIINYLVTPYDKFTTHDIERLIADHIKQVAKENNLQFAEVALLNLLHYVGVCCYRISQGYMIEEPLDVEISKDIKQVSKQILDILKEKNLIPSYSEQEIGYLALFVQADRITSEKIMLNTVIQPYLEDLVNELFEFINEQFGLNLGENLEVRLYLLRHLAALDIRLRFDIQLILEMPKNFIEQYSYAYFIAKQSSFIFENYYEKTIDEKEIYLLSLFIEMIFETCPDHYKKLNIILVCQTGKIGSLLLKKNLENEFSDYVGNIKMCNLFDLDHIDHESYDYIFTTTPIDVSTNIPIVVISDIEGQLNSKKVKDALYNDNLLDAIKNFYSKELFFADIKADSKEQVLYQMISKINEKYDISANSYDCFMQRELLGTTDFVDHTALAHPIKSIIDKNIVCVGILEKPVFWGKREVQLVIMSSIYDSKDILAQKFNEVTANFVFHKESIEYFIQNPSYSVLINELLKCSK